MKIFVLNSGSSSVKYKLFDMTDESMLAQGKVERIGFDDAELSHKTIDGKKFSETASILEHSVAISKVLGALTHPDHGVLKDVSEISAVGHRIVHGGEYFAKSVIVTPTVKRLLERCNELAPLHNPHHLAGINAAESVLPRTPQVAVFDTAFHSSMPPHAYLYALPYVLYERYRIRRYGFHGTSHKYVSQKVAAAMGRSMEELKIISCHLGNGASIAAVNCGKSMDTSMGFTPLEGLMMGTRSGDVDPSVILYVMQNEDLGFNETKAMLNKHSGLIGISGISADMREIEEAMDAGNERAKLAFDMFEYRVRKYIGAYAAAMNGIDAIAFTAGIGEHSPILRKQICDNLTYLGVRIDDLKNQSNSFEISTPDSTVKVFVVPTNEELMIARETHELVTREIRD